MHNLRPTSIDLQRRNIKKLFGVVVCGAKNATQRKRGNERLCDENSLFVARNGLSVIMESDDNDYSTRVTSRSEICKLLV